MWRSSSPSNRCSSSRRRRCRATAASIFRRKAPTRSASIAYIAGVPISAVVPALASFSSSEAGSKRAVSCTSAPFAKAPSIVRLYGLGTTILRDSPDWSELRGHFDEYPAVRQIILAEITRVQTSCGFGVPLMDYKGQREAMPRWAATLSDTKLVEYWEKKNVRSIDGLPAALARRTRR